MRMGGGKPRSSSEGDDDGIRKGKGRIFGSRNKTRLGDDDDDDDDGRSSFDSGPNWATPPPELSAAPQGYGAEDSSYSSYGSEGVHGSSGVGTNDTEKKSRMSRMMKAMPSMPQRRKSNAGGNGLSGPEPGAVAGGVVPTIGGGSMPITTPTYGEYANTMQANADERERIERERAEQEELELAMAMSISIAEQEQQKRRSAAVPPVPAHQSSADDSDLQRALRMSAQEAERREPNLVDFSAPRRACIVVGPARTCPAA